MVSATEEITIGEILRPHGVRGYVRVQPMTDDPRRFELLDSVTLCLANATRKKMRIEKTRIQQDGVLIKFAGVTTRTEAEQLRQARLLIEREQCLPLEKDQYYIFDLVGLQVKTPGGKIIGELQEVLSFPANDVYVVRLGEQEVLIPAITEVIKKVDLATGEMVIEPIDGLLPE